MRLRSLLDTLSTKQYLGINLWLLCLLLAFLAACGGGQNDPTSSGTGSVAFRVTVNNAGRALRAADAPTGDICEDYRIDIMRIRIEKGGKTKNSQELDCNTHNGTLSGINAGTGYRLVLEGLENNSDSVKMRGYKDGLTIKRNETTNAGEITLGYLGATAAIVSPADGSGDAAADTEVKVEFSKPMKVETLDLQTFCVETNGHCIDGDIAYDEATNSATFTPRDDLEHNSTYTVRLTPAIKDEDDISLLETTASFATANVAWINAAGHIVKLSSAREEIARIELLNGGQLGSEAHFAIDPIDGSLWIADTDNDRLIKVDRNGKLLLIIDQAGASGIAIDHRDGSVWSIEQASTPDSSNLVKRSPLGLKLLEVIGTAAEVSVSSEDNAMAWYPGDNSLWVAERDSGLLKLNVGVSDDGVPDGYNISGNNGDHHHRFKNFINEADKDISDAVSVSAYYGDGSSPGYIWAADSGILDGKEYAVLRVSIFGDLLDSHQGLNFYALHHVAADPTSGGVWAADESSKRIAKVVIDENFPDQFNYIKPVYSFNKLGTIEADPMDGGVWVGYGEGLAKLSTNGEQEWLWENGAVNAIAVASKMDTFNKIHVNAASGNDTTGNGSNLAPFQTIQRGIDAAEPGDTIVVAAGQYNETIVLNNAESPKDNIRLVGQDYVTTIIQGSATTSPVISVSNVSSLQISGFTITDAGEQCSGIKAAYCPGLVIQNNRITGSDSTISSVGIFIEDAGGSAEAEPSEVLISQNIISNNRFGGIVFGGESAIIRNNLIFNNGIRGLSCASHGRSLIVNNVIHANARGQAHESAIMALYGDITIENNIITDNGSIDSREGHGVGIYVKPNVSSGLTVAVRYNNIYNNAKGRYGERLPNVDTDNISDDPKYVKPESYDLRLTSASPSKDSGNPYWYDSDRTQSDMGAYGGPWGNW